MTTQLLGLPCPFCRQPRQPIRGFSCGPDGCEVADEVWPCGCEGGRWQLRADWLEEDGHSQECAAATAKAWLAGQLTSNCVLDCGRPDA